MGTACHPHLQNAMTQIQFNALVKLLRLRSSPTLDAVRLHLIDGLGQTDAARQAGADVRLVFKAVARAKAGVKLAQIVVDFQE